MILGLCRHCLNTDVFVSAISESMPKSLALQQKYASLFHIKKCSTQYVAHFIWVTNSLKIGEYATICSTLYVLPYLYKLSGMNKSLDNNGGMNH